MRETEGARLKEDVLRRAETILSIVSKIEERSPQTVEEYRAKLQARLNEMLADVKLDEQRILTERYFCRQGGRCGRNCSSAQSLHTILEYAGKR